MQRFFSILAEARRPLRGHGRQVHRRRDHGRLRRPDRPRGPRPARLLRGAADARRRRRVRGRAAARARPQLLDPDRDQLRRGRRRGDRRRAASGDYTAIGHTVGLAQRMEALAEPGKAYLTEARRRARATATSSSRTSASSRSRARAGRSGSSSWPASARRARGSTSRASAASPASSAATRRWRCSRRRWSGAEAGEGAVVGIVAEPGVGKSRLCHEFAERCRAEGIEVFEAQAPGARQGDPVHAGAADAARLLRDRRRATPSGIAREKIAGRALLLDPELRRGPAADLRLPRRPRSRPARRRR